MTQSGVYVGFDDRDEPIAVAVYSSENPSITKRQAIADCSKGGLRPREFHYDDPQLTEILDRWLENSLSKHYGEPRNDQPS